MSTVRFLAVPAVVVATLAMAGCGTAAPTPPAAPTTTARPTGVGTPARGAVGAPDVAFATQMIPQDTQVVTMADLALKQATNAKIKALAPQSKKAALPRIARMSGWFTSVGGAAPNSKDFHVMAAPPGVKTGVRGTITAKELANLAKAKGPAFDRMWVRLMFMNRTGAVEMAKEELAEGGSPDVKAVAQEVIDRETPRIAELASILPGATG